MYSTTNYLTIQEAERAVINSARMDAISWEVIPGFFKFGYELPDGFSGRYFFKALKGRAMMIQRNPVPIRRQEVRT